MEFPHHFLFSTQTETADKGKPLTSFYSKRQQDAVSRTTSVKFDLRVPVCMSKQSFSLVRRPWEKPHHAGRSIKYAGAICRWFKNMQTQPANYIFICGFSLVSKMSCYPLWVILVSWALSEEQHSCQLHNRAFLIRSFAATQWYRTTVWRMEINHTAQQYPH